MGSHTKPRYTDAEAKAQAEGAKLDDHAAPDDNTDLDASAALHGLLAKADKGKLDGIATGATVYPDTGEQAFLDADHSKLDAIEANATADQTGAEIKTAYEGEANTNAYTDTEKSKLGAIEASATADQTGAEIKTAYEAEAETNAFTDAEKTKLGTVDTDADVTGDNAPKAHTIVSHSDTTATGANLNTLVGGGETALHSHAADGGGATVATGSYTGNGNDNRQITVGFKCSLVFAYNTTHTSYCGIMFPNVQRKAESVNKLTGGTTLHASDGFIVFDTTDNMNTNGEVSYYWAISE